MFLSSRGWSSRAGRAGCLWLLAVISCGGGGGGSGGGQPQTASVADTALLHSTVDTSLAASTGRAITVPAGGDFQAALSAAQLGDEIVLQAGATYSGPFTLPSKSGSGWIIVRSSASSLPPPGTRVGPEDAANMARILAPTDSTPALQTDAAAHHYRFIGIEFTSPVYTFNLVQLGWFETDSSQLPHDIIVDRCYVHPEPTKGGRRGVSLNGNSMAVIDSYVSDFKEVGSDSQAVFGFNGFGPFKIVNNYLEAASENILFGGAAPRIGNLVPSDIEIRHNVFSKPLSWKQSNYNVKNLLELKIAQRVLIDGNEFKNTWPAAQQGWAIVFTPRAESGAAPQAVVQDVAFSNNVVHDVALGFLLAGSDSAPDEQRTFRIAVRNNLFYGVNGGSNGAGDFITLTGNGVPDLSFDHNTVLDTGDIINTDAGTPSANFVFQNNIIPHNENGVSSPKGVGNPTLTNSFPGAVFQRNVIVTSQWASLYPQDNFFPDSLDQVGFVDLGHNNFRLSSSSPFKNAASDGNDVGVDVDGLDAALN